MPAFLSRMVVFDEHGVGVFVAQNAFGPDVCPAVIAAVATALPEPTPRALAPVHDGRPDDPDALVGDYRMADKYETAAFTRARAVLSQPPLTVRIDDQGFVTVGKRRFVHTGELVFEALDDDGDVTTLVFVPGDDGEIAWVHLDRASAYRPAWHARRELHLFAYALAFGLLVVGLVALRRAPRARASWAALGVAALAGMIVPQAYAVIADLGQPVYTQPLRLGIPGWIHAALWLPRVAAAIAALLLALARFRHRAGIAIGSGAVLLLALELYWRTPSPGLARVE